jgi:predicted MFS family arabinose efflux permease
MTNYSFIFGVALLVNVVVTFVSSDYFKKGNKANGSGGIDSDGITASESKAKWTILIRKYLLVYLLALLSDWLQGPFVYALYEKYGYSQQQIAVLFVAGFGSSMVFGSFVGGMADWGGRRAFVVLFCVIYSLSCLTKRKFREQDGPSLCPCSTVRSHFFTSRL